MIIESTVEGRWLWEYLMALPTVGTSGSFEINIPKKAKYIAILNASGATLSYAVGKHFITQPANAYVVSPHVYLGLPIEDVDIITVFWTSTTPLAPGDNKGTFVFSNITIPVQGGAMTTGGVASNVVVTGTPYVNVNSIATGTNQIGHVVLDAGANAIGHVVLDAGAAHVGEVSVNSLPALPTGGNVIGHVVVDSAPSTVVTNVNLDATISSLVTAVNTVNTSVSKQNATTPTIYNLTCTSANTEYSQALPANTKRFTVMNKGNSPGTTWKMYFTSAAGSTMDFPGNVGYTEEMIYLAAQTLYFKSSNAGDVIQILAWV